MKILLDFITFRYSTGAGEYMRRVVNELLTSKCDVSLYAAYDSVYGIAYPDMRKGVLDSKSDIHFIDIHKKNMVDIVNDYKIDTFFIACAQYWFEHTEISDIKCRVISVIHDLCFEEFFYNHLYEHWEVSRDDVQTILSEQNKLCVKYTNFKRWLSLCKRYLKIKKNQTWEKPLRRIEGTINLLHKNHQAQVITVSEYSKNSLIYHYGINEKQITVLYSPLRIYSYTNTDIENSDLQNLIQSKQKYFLLVSANRLSKNAGNVIRAFKYFCQYNSDINLVLVGEQKVNNPRVICLPFLTDYDLSQAYEHCYALLYPSYFEGFGYPPLEAMSFGKPILSSNVTSIPEILGNAPIYFSPFYETDIFKAMMCFLKMDYRTLSMNSKLRYETVSQRQQKDIHSLLSIILNK